jgi:hypothetical protein
MTDKEKPEADADRSTGVESPLTDEAQIGARDRYAAALDMWTGQNEATADLNKATAKRYAALIESNAQIRGKEQAWLEYTCNLTSSAL